MHFAIKHRLYQFGICIKELKIFIQLDCADLYDLAGKNLTGIADKNTGAGIALVPFHIKNNIIHLFYSAESRLTAIAALSFALIVMFSRF